MTIITVQEALQGNLVPPFLINYTDKDAEMIDKLVDAHCKGFRIEDPLGFAQALAACIDVLPPMVQSSLNVERITITYEQYKKEYWCILCKSGMHPRDYAEKRNEQFSFIDDPVHWIMCSYHMPEQELQWIENEDYHKPVHGYSELPDGNVERYVRPTGDLHYTTEPVLVIRSNGQMCVDIRRKFDSISDWIWHKCEGLTDVVGWMRIPKCSWVLPKTNSTQIAANNKMDGEQTIAGECDCRPLSEKD